MTAARNGKNTKNKNSGRNKKASKKATKRVQDDRGYAYRRGVNTALTLIIVLMVGYSGWLIWSWLGRPGLPPPRPSEQTVCLELYFFDNAVTYLVPVHRQVTLAPRESRTSRAITEFALGPRDPHLARIYPDDISSPETTVRDGVAYVDLPREIMSHLGGASRERAFLDALTLTAVAEGECSSVRILIDGQAAEATSEGYDLTEPLTPPQNINYVPDSSLQGESRWVTSYFLDSSGRYLLPLSIEAGADTEGAKTAVEKLLGNPPQLAYPPPQPVCPEGYGLNRLSIENGVATVDLNVPDAQTAFLENNVNLFREAVYLTLKKCCDVNDIKLLMNGRELESYSRFAELPAVAGGACWNPENSSYDAEVNNLSSADGGV